MAGVDPARVGNLRTSASNTGRWSLLPSSVPRTQHKTRDRPKRAV